MNGEAPPQQPRPDVMVAPPLGWRWGTMRDESGLPIYASLQVLTPYGEVGFMLDRDDVTRLLEDGRKVRDNLPEGPRLEIASTLPPELRA